MFLRRYWGRVRPSEWNWYSAPSTRVLVGLVVVVEVAWVAVVAYWVFS